MHYFTSLKVMVGSSASGTTAFIFLGRLMATAYMDVHTSESRRECVQVVWPHRVTGIYTHWKSYSTCTRDLCLAMPLTIALARCTYTLIHEPTSRQPPPWPWGSNVTYIIIHIYNYIGECSTLWGERERGSVVGVYVSSHRKLIGHIGCCRSPQLLAFSAGRAHTG